MKWMKFSFLSPSRFSEKSYVIKKKRGEMLLSMISYKKKLRQILFFFTTLSFDYCFLFIFLNNKLTLSILNIYQDEKT